MCECTSPAKGTNSDMLVSPGNENIQLKSRTEWTFQRVLAYRRMRVRAPGKNPAPVLASQSLTTEKAPVSTKARDGEEQAAIMYRRVFDHRGRCGDRESRDNVSIRSTQFDKMEMAKQAANAMRADADMAAGTLLSLRSCSIALACGRYGHIEKGPSWTDLSKIVPDVIPYEGVDLRQKVPSECLFAVVDIPLFSRVNLRNRTLK
eukprot:gb/GECG01001900.1/.p1 GENE.gb/GECG01001900.1/~~gb/GECG01001900.1/.p1  ORF type:complete len:205 (+),score=17.77 gb/GECG01001900.1/:1-615(+)